MKARRLTLGDILELDQDVVRVEPDRIYRSAGILNRGRGLFEKADVLGAETSYSTLYRLRSGQVVYSRLFGWEGAVATVDDSFDGCCVSGEFPTFRLDTDQASLRYIDHYLKSPVFAALIATAGSGLGQRRQRVNVESLLALPIPLPSRPDQDRIAAHLDSLSEAAARRAERVARVVDVLPRERDRVLAGLLARSAVPLRAVLRQRLGESVDPDVIYPIAGVYGFGRGVLRRDPITGSETKYKTLTRLHEGDVVYSKLKAFEGAVAVADAKSDGFFVSPEFPVFSVVGRMNVRFLGHMLRAPRFTTTLAEASAGIGARRERVRQESFLELLVPLPDDRTQEGVAAYLGGLERAASKRDRVSELADAILPAARNEIFNSFL